MIRVHVGLEKSIRSAMGSKHMKTLLLTSGGMEIKNEILKILPKPAHHIKVAHIITAAKVEENNSYIEDDTRIMRDLGFDMEDIDIEGKTENELRILLERKDMVYVNGGNTFYLLKQVRASGFDRIIKDLISKGVVYIGVSAGSYIACPTIEMASWKHADRNTVGLKDLTALNLVPFLVSAHFKSEYIPTLKKEISRCTFPVRILTDEQAILVKDDNIQLVGIGEEIILL